MTIPRLCEQSPATLQQLVANRQLSCVDLMETFLGWIGRANPAVNAICTLEPELALRDARQADARLAAGESPRKLEGLPVAIKDLTEVKGMRTTYGSPLFKDHIGQADALHVARIREAGAIVIGKTNTPEWGAGSQTFNTLFGATATPYDLSKTAGGSSGGAAAALASRMLPVADGSDLGGSLRNPAAFCNVVGFRPTPGRVPDYSVRTAWSPLGVVGPMGRRVADAAYLLSVMAGEDLRAPLSLRDDPEQFASVLEGDMKEKRIAWSPDLGFLPVDQSVRDVTGVAPSIFEQLGCHVTEAAPDLQEAPAVFQTLRAHLFATGFGAFYRTAKDQLKDTVCWNTEKGLGLSAEEVGRAEVAHTQIYLRAVAFFEDYDFLVLPATQVLPFSKDLDWVREIEGEKFDNYLQWMEICCVISLLGAPAISVPCGFTDDGLPVGLQIVGKPRSDLEVLRMAHAFEQVETHWKRIPQI